MNTAQLEEAVKNCKTNDEGSLLKVPEIPCAPNLMVYARKYFSGYFNRCYCGVKDFKKLLDWLQDPKEIIAMLDNTRLIPYSV